MHPKSGALSVYLRPFSELCGVELCLDFLEEPAIDRYSRKNCGHGPCQKIVKFCDGILLLLIQGALCLHSQSLTAGARQSCMPVADFAYLLCMVSHTGRQDVTVAVINPVL